MIIIHKLNKIACIMALLLFTALPFFECRATDQGPLLLLVHFTSQLDDISLNQALYLLNNGRLPGNMVTPFHVFVDAKIETIIKRRYPSLNFKTCIASNTPPHSDRNALLITDMRGILSSMKVLSINHNYPWGAANTDYTISDSDAYPLLLEGISFFDKSLHTTIAQTGVTAMTRAFMRTVNKHGDLYRPIRAVEAITSAADLAMTSNEVSFVPGCSWPLKDRMLFCSPPSYFDIMKKSGFDIIELTGNHNNDFGWRYNAASIAMLKDAGMIYFGGGENLSEAMKVRYVTIRGKIFSFVGFNQWGPPEAWATNNRAGALKLTRDRFINLISEARRNSHVVFVSVQWGNEDNPVPHDIQVEYFHLAAEMGADILVSSSSHRPMGLEFYRGKFISYGLGNFLFDQMQTIHHRRGLIARHHFYDGRHIQTDLIPYIIQNYSEPVPVHGRAAKELFDAVYMYSRGPVFKK